MEIITRVLKGDRQVYASLVEEYKNEEINTIPLADNNPLPEAKLIETQEISWCLLRLADELRALLIMKYQQGLSFEEIAEITGKSLSAVKMQVYRSLKRLKQLMSEFGS